LTTERKNERIKKKKNGGINPSVNKRKKAVCIAEHFVFIFFLSFCVSLLLQKSVSLCIFTIWGGCAQKGRKNECVSVVVVIFYCPFLWLQKMCSFREESLYA